MTNEGWLKNWVENAKSCVMHYSVSDCRFVDMPLLGVLYIERKIRVVLVSSCLELSMKSENILFKRMLKLLNIGFAAFSFLELIPG